MTRGTPWTGAEGSRPGAARRRSRALAIGALVVALLALGWVVFGGSGTREYTILMQNAGQLVPGDVVRIGSVPAGSVKSLELTPNGQAAVKIALDKSWGRLHEGTTVTVRASGIATVTGRYVDISPGPSFRPALTDGAPIDVDHTTSIVDIDQLLNSFTPPTRRSLAHVIHGFSTWYAGETGNANTSARYFAPSIQAATHLFDQINADSATLGTFLNDAGNTLHALSRRRPELTALITNTRRTTRALGADNRSLSLALRNLPPALRAGSDAFAATRPTLVDLRRLVQVGNPVSYKLAPFFRSLTPVVNEAVPAFHDFRLTFDRPGKSDDLLDALQLLPTLGRKTDKAFPQAQKTLKQSEPVLSFIRPYAPDLISFVRSFGSISATYDANGHYARTVPVFDAFNFTDDAAGGTLTEKEKNQRGVSPYLNGGNLRRCPGASLPRLSDLSAPFVDNGPLANPDCDPSEVVK